MVRKTTPLFINTYGMVMTSEQYYDFNQPINLHLPLFNIGNKLRIASKLYLLDNVCDLKKHKPINYLVK